MTHATNKIQWCLDKAKKELKAEHKHRGLLQVAPDEKRAREHLAKAEHNLQATFYLYEGGYTDWCSSSLFYTIYHCFLAILIKFGYESGNQECTFALIENLIEEKKIRFDINNLKELIKLTTNLIESDVIAKKYEKEMPDRKKE